MLQKIVLFSLLVGLIVVSCLGASASSDTLVIGSSILADGLNPFVEYEAIATMLIFDVWDGLYSEYGTECVPNLFSDLTVSDDGMLYTFTIRQDREFTDGEPLTAYDVAFTYNMIIDNKLGMFTQYTNPFLSVKALDKETVEFKLKQFMSRSLLINTCFSKIPIVPKHIWEGKSKEEILEKKMPVEELVGSGPFTFADFEPEAYIKLERNPMWTGTYRGELGSPLIHTVLIKEYANSSAMVMDLKAGAIDVIRTIPPTLYSELEQIQNITLELLPAVWIDEIIFNSYTPAYEEGRTTHPHPALQDVEVRRALAWALDQELCTQVGLGETGEPANAWLSPDYYGEWCNSELPWRGYDLEKARSILDEAGYEDTDGDGIRETADGLPLEFDVDVVSYLSREVGECEIWARAAKKIGIKLNISALDSGTLWAEMPPNWEFDIAAWDWEGQIDPDFRFRILTCEQVSTSGWSDSGYCNPEYDALYEQQRATTSFEERKRIIWELQEIIYNDLPYLPLSYQHECFAVRNDRVLIDPDIPLSGTDGVLGKAFLVNVQLKN